MEGPPADGDCSFGPWEISSKRSPILKSNEAESLEKELGIPLPEMLFGDTNLTIHNKEHDFKIVFCAKNALKLVDNEKDLMKVAVAEAWQESRKDCEYIKNVIRPFDWTYTTAYKGTIVNDTNVTEKMTEERIDVEKLKKKERIHFYTDLILFEDELGDNGISKMNVKMRVMPSSFFVLLRFFLRVDDVLIRIYDTRIFHEAGTNYILREYRAKEKKIKDLRNPLADENILVDELDCIHEEFTKIIFEPSVER